MLYLKNGHFYSTKWKGFSILLEPWIICIGSTDWQGINHRPHHMLRGLAQLGWNILYVNAPITWLSPLKDKTLLHKWKTQWQSHTVEPHIHVLEPPIIAPFGSMTPLSNIWNQHRIARAINAELLRLHIDTYILYSLLPTATDLLPLLTGKKQVLYDCVDDHASFTGLISKSYVRNMEQRLVQQSDVVFATSHKLAEQLERFGATPILVPNGVHIDHFAKTKDSIEKASKWKQSIGAQVIIGFVGGIADWIDIQLLTELASLRKNYTLVLIGPVLTDISALSRLPNVKVLGPKPYVELPQYVQAFDVGLAPFKLNDLTESVNPVKVYEYLAAGIEVIATPMRELLGMQEAVHIGKNAEEFAQHIDNIVAGSGRIDHTILEKFAKDNAWSHRIAKTNDLLKEITK